MPVQINITGDNAAQAVTELTSLQTYFGKQTAAAAEASQTPIAAQTVPTTPTPPTYPQTGTAPVYGGQPAAQPPYGQTPPSYGQQPSYGQTPAAPPQASGTVPTTAPAYTLDQLGVACQPLSDAGHGPALIGWLQQHGAQALTQLDPQRYGEFATFIRSLGARI